MEIIELAEKKKAFAPPEERYRNPHKEAIRLKVLWSAHKPLSKRKELLEARHLYRDASNLLKTDAKLEIITRLVSKALLFDCHYHPLYALKGDIYMRKGNWKNAITSYESAKLMAMQDENLSRNDQKMMYNERLIDAHKERGDWYWKNDHLLEALNDYEHVLLFRLPGMNITAVQDKLLTILRKLDKYDVFHKYWYQFINDHLEPSRSSALLTMHADYKIYLKEMGLARHMLMKALNLDRQNVLAQELLQKVYSVGHSLAAYSVIWCMHTCYDKALVTVENALDCIPFNPGFTLLKTIILRLCGRFDEATIWLENLSDNFYKLLVPKGDTQRSILGKLSVHETRSHLIKQWYLIRYDMAMQCLLEDKLETAIRIVYRSNLIKHYAESYMLLGDCFYKRDEIDLALESYLKCREKIRELELPFSRKNIDLVERIIDILNDRAEQAITKGQSKRAVEIADQALRILDEDKMPVHLLRLQRGRALLAKARGLFQIESKQEVDKLLSCKTAADSLRFVRELDSDLYATLYSDKDIEGVIDRFAPPRQLPRSLKILMQFS